MLDTKTRAVRAREFWRYKLSMAKILGVHGMVLDAMRNAKRNDKVVHRILCDAMDREHEAYKEHNQEERDRTTLWMM